MEGGLVQEEPAPNATPWTTSRLVSLLYYQNAVELAIWGADRVRLEGIAEKFRMSGFGEPSDQANKTLEESQT